MQTKLLYIAIFSFLLLQACKLKEPDCGDLSDVITNYNISDADKAKIPYTGSDTLIYISDKNDTAILIGQGKYIHTESVRSSLSGGDCPRSSIDNYENIDYNFIGNKTELLNIKFNVSSESNGSGITFYINNYTMGNPIKFYNNPYYYNDSILINTKYYRGNSFNIQNVLNTIYNYKYGFLKIQFTGGKIWYLKL